MTLSNCVHHSWKKAFFDKIVAIQAIDVGSPDPLPALLSYLPDSEAEESTQIRIIRQDENLYSLENEVGRSFACSSLLEAFYALEWAIYSSFLPAGTAYPIFHSAASLHTATGKVVLLMGRRMSGKTSLVLSLLNSDHFSYISEDAVGVDPSTFDTVPYPRPLRLRFGNERLVQRKDGWRTFPLAAHRLVLAVPPTDKVILDNRAGPPSIVLFPEFREGVATRFERLTRGELLALLVSSCVNVPALFKVGGLASLARLSNKVCGLRLTWHDPRDAAREIEALMERREPLMGPPPMHGAHATARDESCVQERECSATSSS